MTPVQQYELFALIVEALAIIAGLAIIVLAFAAYWKACDVLNNKSHIIIFLSVLVLSSCATMPDCGDQCEPDIYQPEFGPTDRVGPKPPVEYLI